MRALPLPTYLSLQRRTPFNTTLANLPRLALDTSATGLSTTSEIKDSVEKQPVAKPSLHGSMQRKLLHSHIQAKNSLHSPKKKIGKWKMMLAGSVGPQLAQNLYKLMTTPHSLTVWKAVSPQQVNTWEEYYDYLNTRNQEGTLGDSLTLMTIAKNNSGRIIEHQHHNSPHHYRTSIEQKVE